jgi:hypothetical protein
MEKAAFIVQQDFQALRLNESNHALISPFGFFQNVGPQFGATYNEHSLELAYYLAAEPALKETVTENRMPAARLEERRRFKQRTFAGKPLSEDEIIRATQLAGELEDELSVRRLLGR